MSLKTVRAALANILEKTQGLSTARGLARTFRHDDTVGDRDKPGDARRFYFVCDSMSVRGPYTPGGAFSRRLDTLRLVVTYADDTEDAAIEDLVSGDYDAIASRLLDSALWADTTIVDVVIAGDSFLPATIDHAAGVLTMTLTLTVEHTR